MINHRIFLNPNQVYGYCACPIALVNKQIYPQGNYLRRGCDSPHLAEYATYYRRPRGLYPQGKHQRRG
jgi:hypothetical protein